MFELVGVTDYVVQEKVGGNFNTETEEEVVALFTTKKLAEDYIKKAKRKHPITESFAGKDSFKKNTLLSGCESAFVREEIKKDLPVNPTI